jgi:cytochrome c5
MTVYKLMFASVLAFIVQLPAATIHANDKYVTSSERKIAQGREIWLQNCESCHGYGIADAPIPMHPDEWGFRLAKGKHVLYEHAINGFMGPDYSMMPARGGNEELNDDDVKLAVDYMIYLAGFYINRQDKL